MYTPPPHSDAEQDVKVREESVSLCDDEVNFAYIPPPFSDEQFVNVAPESV